MSNIYNIHQYKKNHQNPIIEQLIKDKNSYFELEDSIKYNYDTVKSIFAYFHNDYDFLISVCDDICQNVQEDWTLEFLLRTIDILKNISDIPIENYICNPDNMIASNINQKKMRLAVSNIMLGIKEGRILHAINIVLEENPNSNLGVGFKFIEEQFYYSNIIMNHFAKHFISQIFLSLDLEQHLHQSYNSYDEFESNTGELSFIHNYIAKCDTSLDYYTIKHPECLEELSYAFQYIKFDWEQYTKAHSSNIYEKITLDIMNYISVQKNNPYTIDELYDASFYASYRLGIFEEFFRYFVGYDDEYLEMKKTECEQWGREKNDIDSTIIYAQMKKIMNDSLGEITDCKYKQKIKAKQIEIQKSTIPR